MTCLKCRTKVQRKSRRVKSFTGGYDMYKLPQFSLSSLSIKNESCGKNSLQFLELFYPEIIARNFDEGGSSPEMLTLFLQLSFQDVRIHGRTSKEFVFKNEVSPGSSVSIIQNANINTIEIARDISVQQIQNVLQLGWSGIGVQDPYIYKGHEIPGHFIGFVRDPRYVDGKLLFFNPEGNCETRRVTADDFFYDTGSNWKKLDSVIWIKRRITGSLAKTRGLQSRIDLNEQSVLIKGHDANSDRYEVEFLDGLQVKLKTINLV